MKSNPSKKHHYLPRCYLKGFTDSAGRFFVYDKHRDKTFLSAPDSSFFENHLNTVAFPDGSRSDFLEGLYAEMENKCCDSLDNIRHSTHGIDIDPFDKIVLFLFILFLHWRLPSNISVINRLSEQMLDGNGDLDYFKIHSSTGSPVPREVIEEMRNSPAFKKAAKMIAPFAPFFVTAQPVHEISHSPAN